MRKTILQICGLIFLSLVAGGARNFQNESAPPTNQPVVFFPRQVVDDSFAKGSALIDGSGGRNYKVLTGHRDTPGMVELHAKDTDIIYVVKGTATIVTGGTIVDAKTTAADEIRGREITGGDSRALEAGDVLIIPNGIPHWFKEVSAPFLYFVVKSR
jgi:mannose-6-phosphate isomerase-like protein (cupin superfamily)